MSSETHFPSSRISCDCARLPTIPTPCTVCSLCDNKIDRHSTQNTHTHTQRQQLWLCRWQRDETKITNCLTISVRSGSSQQEPRRMCTHISCKERDNYFIHSALIFRFFCTSTNSRLNGFHLCDSSFRFNFPFDDDRPLGIAIPKGSGQLTQSSAKNNNKNVQMRGKC